jgi:hypothetical protein
MLISIKHLMSTKLKTMAIAMALSLGATTASSQSSGQDVSMAKDLLFGNVFDAEGVGQTGKSFEEFAKCAGDWAKSKSSRATYELKEIEGTKVVIIGVSRGPVFVAIDEGAGQYKTKYINTMAGRIIRDGAMNSCI